jgi:hypothetical protein
VFAVRTNIDIDRVPIKATMRCERRQGSELGGMANSSRRGWQAMVPCVAAGVRGYIVQRLGMLLSSDEAKPGFWPGLAKDEEPTNRDVLL